MMLLLVAVLLATTASAATADAVEGGLRVLTWNVRYDSQPDMLTPADSIAALPAEIPPDEPVNSYAGWAEAPWSTRRIDIAREVAFARPDIIGSPSSISSILCCCPTKCPAAIQEAKIRQVKDLETLFVLPGGGQYSRIGVGRDDGIEAGEFSAIYYRRSTRLVLETWDTFWLSESPLEPSKYPGAGSYRSATRALFRTPQGRVCIHLPSGLSDG